jgi:methyltransferase (TIGR00027 family)
MILCGGVRSEDRGLSRTAENMAVIRALETVKPQRERLFSDPFAKRFLPGWQSVLASLARIPAVRRLLERYFDRQAPGARTSGAARTRLIDDWIRQALADGIGQVVILGAGFDCRALRMKELASVPIFEVDRARMIDFKDAVLKNDAQPRNLKRVPVDFLKDRLGDRLGSAGFSTNAKTLFVWEGVTNYLDAASVSAVFDFFAGSAPSGSKVVFTYVHSDAINGLFPAAGLERLTKRLRDYGEPWTFGFHPNELAGYLTKKGIRLLADISAAEYRRMYMPNAEMLIGYEFYRAVLAEVMTTEANSDAAR